MFYEALVLDNREFFNKGTIRVRAPYFYNYSMNWDLSQHIEDVEMMKGANGKYSDIEAYLFAPLGGGNGYGTLIIPQINERGFIFFPENDFYKTPVWIGSYFRPFFDETNKLLNVNAPSNLTDKDGIDVNEETNINNNPDEKDNILIRTKNTEYEVSSPEKLNWSELPTSNILSISNEGIKARHYNKENGWKDKTANNYSDVNITDSQVEISNINKEEGTNFNICITDKEMTLDKDGKTKITIDKDGNVTIDTPKKIYFNNAETIEFLGNNRHLVGYEELYDALDTYVAHHIHITPNGPSKEPLDSSMAPLKSVIKQDLMDMKEKRLLTE